jgi:hypothetical protein
MLALFTFESQDHDSLLSPVLFAFLYFPNCLMNTKYLCNQRKLNIIHVPGEAKEDGSGMGQVSGEGRWSGPAPCPALPPQTYLPFQAHNTL